MLHVYFTNLFLLSSFSVQNGEVSWSDRREKKRRPCDTQINVWLFRVWCVLVSLRMRQIWKMSKSPAKFEWFITAGTPCRAHADRTVMWLTYLCPRASVSRFRIVDGRSGQSPNCPAADRWPHNSLPGHRLNTCIFFRKKKKSGRKSSG